MTNKFTTTDSSPDAQPTSKAQSTAQSKMQPLSPVLNTSTMDSHLPQTVSPADIMNTTTPIPPPPQTYKRVTLFVNDLCQATNPLYCPQSAELILLVHPDIYHPHKWQFYAKDLMHELQKSNARVEGQEPVSIGQHHNVVNMFFQLTFARNMVLDDFENFPFNPDTLLFPNGHCLFLVISARAY
ncbi:hypothetical protein L218DRAFT_1005664 [Marasmius fiardii PR-910]|nr:hypothetical protein L218DRAFT_1005664 [Marasmius fiardii PR-910]